MLPPPDGARQATVLALAALLATLGLGALAWVLDPEFVRERLSADGQLTPSTAEWLRLYATIAWVLTALGGGAAAACFAWRRALAGTMARHPLVLRRFALTLGAGVAALLLAELAVRVIGVAGVGSTSSAAYRDYSRNYEESVADQLDARGYRETRLGQPAPVGTSRILVVGDSFVFGFGVTSAEDTYPAALERRLAVEPAIEAPRYEVLNAGQPGADSVRTRAVLRELLPGTSPDLVLIGYYVNDCESVEEKRAYFASRHLLPVISENLERVSQLWWLVENAIVRHLEATGRRPSYVEHLLEQTAAGSEAWEEHRTDLLRLLERAGRPAAMVMFPLITDFEHYPLEALHERVAAEVRAAGVPVLDLRDAFRGRLPDEIRVSSHDPHLNELGLLLAAEATAAFLSEQELLPRAR